MSNIEDVEKIKGFIQSFQKNLGLFVNESPKNILKFGFRAEDESEVKKMQQFYRESLPQFKKMLEYLESDPVDAAKRLTKVGLTGESLDEQLSLVDEAESDIQEFEKIQKEAAKKCRDDAKLCENNVYGSAFADYRNVVLGLTGGDAGSDDNATDDDDGPASGEDFDDFCQDFLGSENVDTIRESNEKGQSYNIYK